jgi:hypothetical protein
MNHRRSKRRHLVVVVFENVSLQKRSCCPSFLSLVLHGTYCIVPRHQEPLARVRRVDQVAVADVVLVGCQGGFTRDMDAAIARSRRQAS